MRSSDVGCEDFLELKDLSLEPGDLFLPLVGSVSIFLGWETDETTYLDSKGGWLNDRYRSAVCLQLNVKGSRVDKYLDQAHGKLLSRVSEALG